MEKVELGKLCDESSKRDAVHVAVAPVVAGEDMLPGLHVGFLEDGTASGKAKHRIGVVDPFLPGMVRKGQRFFLCLYPNTVTSLRHEWLHPAFDDAAGLEKSIAWLKEYAERNCPYDEGFAYSKFMERVRDGEIFYHGSDLHGAYELEDAEELFGHLSIVLGRPVGASDFEYGCSC